MKKLVIAVFFATMVCCATAAMATSFYYEATNVSGVATLTYGTADNDWHPPEFKFIASEGSVDTNFDGFVMGSYDVSVYLSGFWLDGNEDGKTDFTLPEISQSLGTYDIPLIPLAGTQGDLSWKFDPYKSLYLSYDFGNDGTYTNNETYTNKSIGLLLAGIDSEYSGNSEANGVMNANIGWGSLRVELNNTAPVPEPGTMVLLGSGLLGLAGYGRRRRVH